MSLGTIFNKLYFSIFIAAIAFLAFVGGSLITLNESFPYDYINNAYRAGSALLEQQTGYTTPYVTNLWAAERTKETGVTTYDPTRAGDGMILYTSGHAQKAFLMTRDGTVVHEWHLPFSEVWDETAAVKNPRPDPFVFIERAQLFPNGDLLALYIGLGDTPWGYGLVKMDKDSNIVWKYLAQAHHDLDVDESGRVYVLTHEVRFTEIESAAHLKPPRVDDFVAVLSPDGKELKKVSILDAFARSDYLRLLSTVPWFSVNAKGDFLHTNTIELIDREAAAKLPFASEGQVLLSFRDLGVIAVLDLETEEIVWALRGPWLGQHDPDILANGDILLFDNMGHYGDGGQSRVIEFDPETLEIVWSYVGDRENRFESFIRSGQERLPNGNTLITESDGGRIFEVTPEGDIVWEFVNPVRGGEAGDRIPVLSIAQWVDPSSLEPGFPGTQDLM